MWQGSSSRRDRNTVIGRRSADASRPLDGVDFAGEAGPAPAITAIASSNRLRSPTTETPMSLRSSTVSRGSRSASILLSRNFSSYWPSPRPRSHPPTSIAAPHMAWQDDHSDAAACPAAPIGTLWVEKLFKLRFDQPSGRRQAWLRSGRVWISCAGQRTMRCQVG